MSLMTKLCRNSGAAIISFALVSGSHAAMVSLEGDNVRFTFDDSTVFGSAYVVGDSLMFAPTDFSAEALNNSGLVTRNGTLNIRVELLNGAKGSITGLSLLEQGDYEVDGTGNAVDVDGRFQVSSLTQTGGSGLPLNYSAQFDAGDLDADNVLTGWEVSEYLSLSDSAGWGSDSALLVQVQNTLEALARHCGSQAFVQKNFVALGVDVTPVPLPAAGWLFGAALAGLAARSRKRH